MRKDAIILLLLTLALVGIGLDTVYGVSAFKPQGMALFERQLFCMAVGVCFLLYLATRFDYHRFSTPFIFRGVVVLSLFLLIAVLIPGIGVEVNGAQRWIRVLGFQFQPSEFAKLALIILLARKLSENYDVMGKFWRGFLPAAIIAGAFAGLILLERDLGVPAVVVCVSFLMIYVAGAKWYYIIGSFMPAVAGAVALIIFSPYRFQRLIVYLDPFAHRNDGGFHLIQSLAAFARGSYYGVGPGLGEQKLYYLPAAHTDFIFAVWGEDMGLLGTGILLAMFVLFLKLGAKIAKGAPDLFGTLLATGITAVISVQAAFNMGVTIGLLPTKGLTLPFISYGGTAQIVLLIMVGILLNIGLQSESPDEEPEFVLAH